MKTKIKVNNPNLKVSIISKFNKVLEPIRTMKSADSDGNYITIWHFSTNHIDFDL